MAAGEKSRITRVRRAGPLHPGLRGIKFNRLRWNEPKECIQGGCKPLAWRLLCDKADPTEKKLCTTKGQQPMENAADETVLDRFLKWEQEQHDDVYLTQPYPDGTVAHYSWGEVGDQARRMASHLVSRGLPKESRIALLGRNSAHCAACRGVGVAWPARHLGGIAR